MIIVIDTNVWVSGILFAARGGVPTQALEKARDQDCIAICDEIEAEIYRILIDKFGSDPGLVRTAIERSLVNARRVTLSGTVMGCRDRKDDMFLECAWRAKAELLVAGDKDLLVMKTCKGTRIVTPKEYVGG